MTDQRSATRTIPTRVHTRRVVIFAGLWFTVACTGLIALGQPLFNRRLRDLRKIRTALEAYRVAHGFYPKAAAAYFGQPGSAGAGWIPELVPAFMATLPRDPRHHSQPNMQYVYMSDGADYKLIAHGAEDAAWVNKHHPNLADPRRPAYAYGYWSFGAASW